MSAESLCEKCHLHSPQQGAVTTSLEWPVGMENGK